MTIRHTLFVALLLLHSTAFAQWVQRTDVGSPGQRTGHAMAYDSFRGVTVFFGGEIGAGGSETYFNDTWEYDGTHWQQIVIADIKPSTRSGHAMCYDSVHHEVLLTGGVNEDGYCNDFWAYHSDEPGHGSWQYRGGMGSHGDLLDNGYAVAGHAMVFDEHRGVAVRIGGYGVIVHLPGEPDTIGISRDFAYFHPDDHIWRSVKNIINIYSTYPLTRLSACYDPINQSVLYYGGNRKRPDREFLDSGLDSFTLGEREYVHNGNGDEFWYYSNPDWFAGAFRNGSPGTQQSAVVFDQLRDRVVVFGGQNDPDQTSPPHTDATLEFAPNHYPYPTPRWLYTGPDTVATLVHPPGRAGHAMVYDSQRHVTVMVGGVSGDTRYDDTWELPSIPATGPAWVDFSSVEGDFGSIQFPYSTLAQAVKAASTTNRDLSIVGPRTSRETITLRDPMTLRAVGGPVTIGQP